MRHAAGIAEKVTLIVSPMHCVPKHHSAFRGRATRCCAVVPGSQLVICFLEIDDEIGISSQARASAAWPPRTTRRSADVA